MVPNFETFFFFFGKWIIIYIADFQTLYFSQEPPGQYQCYKAQYIISDRIDLNIFLLCKLHKRFGNKFLHYTNLQLPLLNIDEL